MKKIIALLTVFVLIITAGCANKGIINDPDTGLITPEEPEFTYTDGKYIVYTDYYDPAGYAAAIQLIVTEGIITQSNFDIFDTKLNRYTKTEDEALLDSAEALRTEIKSLNTHLMQAQSSTGLKSVSEYGSYYIILVRQAIKNAAEGVNTPTAVSLRQEYRAEAQDTSQENTPPLISGLTAAFMGDEIISLNFSQTMEGKRVQDWPNIYPSVEQEEEYTYSRAIALINEMPENSESLIKESPCERAKALFNTYNTLAEEITKRHKKFEANYSSLFSNL
ncbi:MAG: hypothetical protein GX061_00675 [Eubacteriaceae bacterium]|nr:hypothetical protein [Eubacteriaceae bacterium]